jgi:hypothetical protein
MRFELTHTTLIAIGIYPSELSKVMRIIHRAISTHIVSRAGFTNKQAKTGAVKLIQGFSSALILPPRINLTRFFAVFAPNSNLRAQVTASQRGKNSPKLNNQEKSQSDKPYHARSMSWAQRLKGVFNIDITECEKCQKHNVTIISCITQSAIIQKDFDFGA